MPTVNAITDIICIGAYSGNGLDGRGDVAESTIIGNDACTAPRVNVALATNDGLHVRRSVILGHKSCYQTQGDDLVVIGANAIANFDFVAIAGYEGGSTAKTVVIGARAAFDLRAGDSNTVVGYDGAGEMRQGAENVVIGASTRLGPVGSVTAISDKNIIIGFSAGSDFELDTSIAIGRKAGRALTATATNRFIVEHIQSALHAGDVPYLFGDLADGNLMLGNRDDATGPINRLFGTGAVNNLKIQEGTVPTTAPDRGVSLFVQNTAGVFSLRCIGPGGVAQILATGL